MAHFDIIFFILVHYCNGIYKNNEILQPLDLIITMMYYNTLSLTYNIVFYTYNIFLLSVLLIAS